MFDGIWWDLYTYETMGISGYLWDMDGRFDRTNDDKPLASGVSNFQTKLCTCGWLVEDHGDFEQFEDMKYCYT